MTAIWTNSRIDEEETVAIQCDVCKKIYKKNEDAIEVEEFLYLRRDCGYNSVFGDENSIETDICQHCQKKLLGDYLRIIE